MDTIINLNQCGGLKEVKTVLDIGARNTEFAKRLLNFKIEKADIVLTDIQPLVGGDPDGFNFIQTSIEDMHFDTPFDLVVCARVLPFTEKPLENLRKVLRTGNTVYVSLFGQNDERGSFKVFF